MVHRVGDVIPSLLSPAGARDVTRRNVRVQTVHHVAVPRRGASCYVETTKIYEKNISRCCPPQGRELLRDNDVIATEALFVAVPRRGASCYTWQQLHFALRTVAVPRRGASRYRKLIR